MEAVHMNGAGNDFVILDARGKHLDFVSLSRQLCAAAGADGFMAVDFSETADFKLHFYNSDGSRGEMCGNGARCICRYAYEHGIAGETMTVETDAGLVFGQRLSRSLYRITLNTPSVLDLCRKEGTAYVELGNPGIPHAVREYKGDLWKDAEALKAQMRALRLDPAFPKGANVDFYQWIGPETLRILTYERGVEDFTLACGTGSGSVAAVVFALKQLPGGVLTACNRGGTLKVTVSGREAVVDSLLLEGPTEIEETLTL